MAHITRATALASNGESTIEESPLLLTDSVSDTSTPRNPDPAPRSLDAGITLACLASGALMCLSPLQYGYHIAELNTPKGIITACDKDAVHWPSLPLCLPMNDAVFSLATSIFAVGGLLGSLSAGWMAERWGRRGALVYNSASYILGPLLMAFAVSPAMLVIGRFVSGIGSGVAVVVAPLYLSEIAPVRYRGTLNLLNQLSIVLGILATLTVGMLANEGPYWRLSVGFGLVLACLHLSIIAFAVESPRYLWSRNRRAEARIVLRKLRQTTNVDDEVAGWQTISTSRHVSCPDPTGEQPAGLEASDSHVSSSAHELPLVGNAHDNIVKVAGEDGSQEQHLEHVSVTIFNIFRFAEYRKPWML
ncbi:hypothetical protein GGH95_003160, partial [Coemansia sp. RSA 1836]